MSMTEIVKVFGERKIRSVWDDVAEEWYFSVVDVVAVLTESADPRNYWKVLKNRLKKEGNESVTNCNQLKLKAVDGKFYKTDVATPEQMFRLIQSIPSPKAEPFKIWMAKVAAGRLNYRPSDLECPYETHPQRLFWMCERDFHLVYGAVMGAGLTWTCGRNGNPIAIGLGLSSMSMSPLPIGCWPFGSWEIMISTAQTANST